MEVQQCQLRKTEKKGKEIHLNIINTKILKIIILKGYEVNNGMLSRHLNNCDGQFLIMKSMHDLIVENSEYKIDFNHVKTVLEKQKETSKTP